MNCAMQYPYGGPEGTVQKSLGYKKPLYKKLKHTISEKTMDKTISYCSKTIG